MTSAKRDSLYEKERQELYEKMEELLDTGCVVSSGGGDAVHREYFHCGSRCNAKAAEK